MQESNDFHMASGSRLSGAHFLVLYSTKVPRILNKNLVNAPLTGQRLRSRFSLDIAMAVLHILLIYSIYSTPYLPFHLDNSLLNIDVPLCNLNPTTSLGCPCSGVEGSFMPLTSAEAEAIYA
ncbi:uncharacterized protein BDV14DRAFT_127220 [Aspergillus stella-maris]|uniref:uncharacterized protein n=1 Tax=Aspergillus stella-maris TaxID=1810926 RepID=UPI003CCE2DFA